MTNALSRILGSGARMLDPAARLLGPVGALSIMVLPAAADPPKKPSVAQFSRLINESPFTIKPPPADRAPVATPLERDWMLGSIRPNQDGYSVTLINKKDRKERIRFIPGFSTGDFKLLKVEQDTENVANSRVQVSKGGVTAWLTYDEKLIQIRPAVAPTTTSTNAKTQNSAASGRNGGPIPGNSSTNGSSRPRTIPKNR